MAATVVLTVGIIVVVRVMAHPLAIAISVVVLVIGLVTALILLEVVLGNYLPSSVAVVAGETVFLDQIGLVTVTWMIVMMVAVMDTVTLLITEIGMMGAVIVMPVTVTHLVVIALVQTGMEVQTVISQVVMVGSEREATREMQCVAVLLLTGVAQEVVQVMTGMAQGAALVVAMTGMVHVEAVLTTMLVEDLLAMMEEVTGTDLGHMTVPAGEDAMRIASNDLLQSSYVFVF